MAVLARLKDVGPGTRLLALLAAVLLLHAWALGWLARQLEEQTRLLTPFATPMFTRVLVQEAPVATPVVHATTAAPPPRPKRERIAAVAPPPPAPAPERAASEPAKPEPVPEPPKVAQTPAPAASAPVAVAAASAASSASSSKAGLDTWPADTRVNYRLGGNYRGELHGSARVQWQRQDDRYQARVDIDITLLASLVLTSQGEVTPQGLAPRVYEELRRGGPRGAKMGDDTITLNDGRTVPRPAGVQDTASQFVELGHRFATGQAPLEVGRTVSFWMARPGGVDLWTYDIVEREVLQTPTLGAVDTFHLKPRAIANPRGNITAEMWFAPSLQYLPVRIKVNMGETFVDLMAEKIEQR